MSGYGGGANKITVRCKNCGKLLKLENNQWIHAGPYDCYYPEPIAGEPR